MTDLPFRSAVRLAAMLRRKEIGCAELLDIYAARIERYNPAINAIIFTDLDSARQRALAADRALAAGNVWGPLHGIPITVKESFDVVGMPTTWGIPEYRNHIADRNAIAVDRFLKAGAVVFGKTNVPLYLADWQTFNEIYGTTNNPWDLSRVPGGSSGGSAAALAAGLTALEAGSDIGASIRNPAHYCGVYGHKPTYGIVSPMGQSLPGALALSDIAVIGPLARSAEDLALALDVMAGPDPIDETGWQLRLPRPEKKRLSQYKVAVVYSDSEAEVDEQVQTKLRELVEFLRKSGTTVVENVRPRIDSKEAHRNYIQLLRSATSGRMTSQAFDQNLRALGALDPEEDGYQARMIRAQAMYHRDWLASNQARHRMRLAWADFFRNYDVFLCPAATTAAFKHNQKGQRWERMVTVNGEPQPSTTQMFWAGYSCNFYLPATVAPLGLTETGLPVGVQIVAPQYGDYTAIQFAGLIESEYQGFQAPPGYEA